MNSQFLFRNPCTNSCESDAFWKNPITYRNENAYGLSIISLTMTEDSLLDFSSSDKTTLAPQ